jgi:hypothetical protein
MKQGFIALLLAAGLAGCGGIKMTPTPSETRNDKEAPLPPGQGALGDALSWERKPSPAKPAVAPAAPAAAASAAEQEEFKKWQESAGRSERSEFEEWRAWQEWKRKNPK